MARPTPNRWWVKAALQGMVSTLPRASALTDAVRSRRTPYLTQAYFLSKWHHVREHLRALEGHQGRRDAGTCVVEIGTGWFPIVPLGLAVHDCQVVTVDVAAHLDADRVRLAMQVLSDLAGQGQITVGSPVRLALLRELLDSPAGATVSDLLGPLGVTSHVADATDLSALPDAHGAALFVSNNTLEHIPAETIRAVFAEFGRVGSPDAQMSHYIDLADHYAGSDPSISEFHFLTLGPRRWRLANNRLGYQNRLQIGDYQRLLAETGWVVTREVLTRRKRGELERLDLVPPFDTMPVSDLLVVKAHLVAQRVEEMR